MKASETPKIQDLLPELFTQPDKPVKAGGMCTPGSGCDPIPQAGPTDLLKLLNGSISAPPDPGENNGNATVSEHPSETAAPCDEKTALQN